MANPEHLAILQQALNNDDISLWNTWRQENFTIAPDVSGAVLSWMDLTDADLRRVNLSRADLRGADLTAALLDWSDLSWADLRAANLSHVHLKAVLMIDTNVADASFVETTCNRTVFSNVDFSQAKHLDTVKHEAPSYLDLHTVYRSQGNIPEIFLQGCGVADEFIIYARSLIGVAATFYSCFISYSEHDKIIAERIYEYLQDEGIRCWLDEKPIERSDDISVEINRGLRYWDKVLLCCSEHALTSAWVDTAIEATVEKERQLTAQYEQQVITLMTISLDTYLNDDFAGDRKRPLQARLIADFSGWKHNDTIFEREIDHVLRALRVSSRDT